MKRRMILFFMVSVLVLSGCGLSSSTDNIDKEETVEMTEYVRVVKDEDWISICMNVDEPMPYSVGKKMRKINRNAYMNGYNWEAFFDYYLQKYEPELAKELEYDSEAGMFCAYFSDVDESDTRGEQLAEIMYELINDEEKICNIVREEGDEIAWD